MAEAEKARRSRSRLWIAAGAGVVLLAGIVALAWYVRSPHFADFVRHKMIVALADATGGRVELRSFYWDLAKLEFAADDLTIHGREGSDELPYAHVDRVDVRLRIVSFLRTKLNLQYLGLEHPVVHLIVYPDGSTNAPEPKIRTSMKNPVQQLFELEAQRADLRHGMLLLNRRALPLDFTANDVAAEISYAPGQHRYDGKLHVGRMDAAYRNFRDVAAQGDAEFTLEPNAAQIKSLKLTAERSSLELSGKLTDYGNPRLEFDYTANIDLGQLGAVARVYPLRSGTLALSGAGKYSQAGYSSRGRILLRTVDYVEEGLALRNISAGADFSLENARLVLTHITGRLLGGEVSGDAEVRNLWSTAKAANGLPRSVRRGAPVESGNKIVGPGPQQGSGQLRVSGASLAEIARALSTKRLPLDKLAPAGNLGGTVDLAWIHSLADAQTQVALDAVALAQPPSNQLPVNGNLRARYSLRTRIMEISSLTLATPHTHVSGSGTLGSTSANLKLAADSTSLAEFQPLLAANGYAPPPVELAGQASIDGTVSGKLREPQINGHVEATNFTYLYTPESRSVEPPPAQAGAKRRSWFRGAAAPPPEAQPAAPQPRRVHVDQFTSDVQYSSSAVALHHAVIHEGAALVTLDGTASLQKGSFRENSPFQVKLALHDADISELQRAGGLSYPVSGRLNLTLQAGGTQTNLHGEGQLSVSAAQAYGHPIQSLASRIAFVNHEGQLKNMRVQAAHGVVEGAAAYNFQNKSLRFDLRGENIALAEIPELQLARLHTSGSARFTAKGSGTLEQPVVNGRLGVSSLVLNGEPVGAVVADAVTHGRQLQLTARSAFSKTTLLLAGDVELRGDMPGKMTVKFSGLDVDPFLPTEIRGHITGHSSMSGQTTLEGPLKQPRLLRGDLRIEAFSVEVERVPIASDGPIEVALSDELLSVQRCSLVSEDSRVTFIGRASLKDDRRIDLRSQGSVNLKFAHILDPDVSSYGLVNIDVAVNGTAANPVMSGRINIEHAGLSMIDAPAALGDINGSLVLNQNRIEVERLTARTGGGLLNIAGFVTYGRTIGVNLTAQGTEIRFRYAGISVTSDQTLHLQGTLQNTTLSGDITVTRFAQIPSSDLTFAVAQASGPPRVPNPRSPLNNLHFDVRIASSPELTVQTSLAKLSGDVDLSLRGTAARPVLLGRINVAEGDIKLNGTKYHLERGDITFTDPVRIDPVLNIEATTRVRDYDITIGLHGTMERLNTTYRSDPPLSSEDIVALLAFGRTQQENAMNTTPQSGFAETASGAMIGEAINQTLSNRVTRLFGVSSIRINPAIGGPDNNPNARLSIEQQVSQDVTLTYITNLTRSAQQVIQFEYNISRDYTVQGIRDENGVVSFDLLVRKRKR
jgi:translocation and assembly module TamB